MNPFVAACRREWVRIGVPDAAANEMAADLEADLAEAEADGVSPEHVLGNGYFDPASFAASWASAAGVAGEVRRTPKVGLRRRWLYVAGALAFAAIGLLGIGLLAISRRSAIGISKRALLGPGFRMHVVPGMPGPFFKPTGPFAIQSSHAPAAVGLLLLLAALVGIGITLWMWRPWSSERNRSGPDRDIGMPSYL